MIRVELSCEGSVWTAELVGRRFCVTGGSADSVLALAKDIAAGIELDDLTFDPAVVNCMVAPPTARWAGAVS